MLLTLLLLLPLLTGLSCMFLRGRRALELTNLCGFAGAAIVAVSLGRKVLREGSVSAYDGFLYADALSALVAGLTAFVALFSGIYAVGFFRHEERSGIVSARQLRRYYRLTPLFVFAMHLVVLSNNLGVMWVSIEGTTLASVLLIAFYNQQTSLEAAWKYIIIGSVGISLALFGTIVTYYAAAGVLGAETGKGLNWSLLVTLAEKFNPGAMKLAFVLVLLGYGTKAGLVPMHTWKPDAYSEAPIPAAAILGAGVINCALYGLLRFYVLGARCLGHAFTDQFFLWFGLGSMALAAPFILVQRNFRRLLAYSSIEHAGIMVAAVGFGGTLGALGAMLHMVFHAITKPLLFFSAGNIQQHFGTPLLRKIRGAITVLPISGAAFIMAVLAVTGTPPFSIFQSEFKILSAALASHHSRLALIFLACVVTIFAGFLRHAVEMVLGQPQSVSPSASFCVWKVGTVLFLAACVLLLGFWLPAPLFELINHSAAAIAGLP